MKTFNVLILLFFTILGSSFAQDNSIDGKWKAKWQGESREQEATVVIEKNGGTWQTLYKNKFDQCIGLKVPISIESLTQKGMTMKLMFTGTVQGCKDATFNFHRVDESTFLSANGKYKLVRD